MVNSMNIIQQNRGYWDERAQGYRHINEHQLESNHAVNWKRALVDPIKEHFNTNTLRGLNILDIGCGPGIFSIILASEKARVTALDYSTEMLEQAMLLSKERNVSIKTIQGDAQNLPFSNHLFDVVVSRNVTWNLEHPELAYSEWRRVVRPGGLIVNFDANWYRYLIDKKARAAYNADRLNAHQEHIKDQCEIGGYERMEDIARMLPLTKEVRPQWDLSILTSLNMTVHVDTQISAKVWDEEEKLNFASTPLFRIIAKIN